MYGDVENFNNKITTKSYYCILYCTTEINIFLSLAYSRWKSEWLYKNNYGQ